MRRFQLTRAIAAACLAVAAAASAAQMATASAAPLENPIVFVEQRPVPFTFATIADIFGNFTSYDPAEGQPVGGNLMRLDPDGRVTALTRLRRGAVRDPEISWDGERVIFALKRKPRGRWQIWSVGVDGRGLERISRPGAHNEWDPAWLPDGRVLFLSDRLRWADGYENLPEGQLFVMEGDGRTVRPLAVNPSGIFNPLLGSDGLVYFTQWDFADCRESILEDTCDLDVNRFLPWKVALDGSREGHPSFGMHTLYDFSGGYVGVREDPRRPNRFFATLADEFFTWGAGELVELAPRPNGDRDRPRRITPRVFLVEEENRAGRYRDPYPLADGRLVAAYAPGAVYNETDDEAPAFRLVMVDRRSGATDTLLERPGAWLLQPVEAVARKAPELAAGTAVPGFDYGILNSKDVTLRHRNCDRVLNGDCQPTLAPGEAAAIRIFRVARRKNYYRSFRRYADPRRELLGEAPVAADGSFAAAVPAWTPLIWEAVDAAGNTLVAERFWSEVAAGEVRTCNGCHAPHTRRPVRRSNSALYDVTNLSGVDVDRDGNGLVDLLERIGLVE